MIADRLEVDRTRVVVCLVFDQRSPVTEIEAFKRSLIDDEAVVHAVEAAGAYDLMLELSVSGPDGLTRFLHSFAVPIAMLVARHEISQIDWRHPRQVHRGIDRLWIPCGDGLRRIACGDIDRFVAERDYVRIHSGHSSWLLKSTMHRLAERLDASTFLHVHRSAIVRREFIDHVERRLGRWEALLIDGSRQTVSRSHLPETLRQLGCVDARSNAQFVATPGSSRLASP